MNAKIAKPTLNNVRIIATACLMAVALVVCSCGKPTPDAEKSPSPAKSAAQGSPSAQPGQGNPSVEGADMDLATAAVKILNAAHRNGAVILKGECGQNGASVQGSASGQSGSSGRVDRWASDTRTGRAREVE